MTARRGRWGRRLALGVAGILIAGWWWWDVRGPRGRPTRSETSLELPPRTPSERAWTPRGGPRERAVDAPGCAPRQSRRCQGGDAWWVDGCGRVSELAQECGFATCEDGRCSVDDPECENGPTRWSCEGEVAVGCVGGEAFESDCAADGMRCVMGEDGPVCRPRSPDDCDSPAPPRCVADTVVACEEGRWSRVDCSSLGARCETDPAGRGRCVRRRPVPGESCGPCGCPPSYDDEEVCDGRDNDGDGIVDEGVSCPEVELRAWVVTDAHGDSEYTPDDLDEELERVSSALSDPDHGLSVRWGAIEWIAHEEWLDVEGATIDEVLSSALLNRPTGDFAVPIVFVRSLLVDGVPRPGLATPPNGTCGGRRRVDRVQPPVGGVIIAKRRWPTTVVHEVGHYLGLCHTHTPSSDVVETWSQTGPDAVRCDPACRSEGDGVCDTPPDPGPPVCAVDETCLLACDQGEQPDPTNVMAYYPACREGFTAEQRLILRDALDLRRGWHACLTEAGCACDPLESTCPRGMGCKAFGGDGPWDWTWRCELEGPVVPGGTCADARDCGYGGLCVGTGATSRCARPCAPMWTECDCRPLEDLGMAICADDLRIH